MDLRKIKKLIELVEESGLSELEVKSGDEAVRIVRPLGQPGTAPALVPAAATPVAAEPLPEAGDVVAKAPMAGTFYAAPEPGAPPFAEVGSRVQTGDVLCIIESMKMMNEIRAEQDGEIVGVLVENGEPVGSGQALFRLR